MSYTITERQAALLAYIKGYIAEKGTAPLFDEMRAHMAVTSRSAIHRWLTSLERRGHIRRLRYVTRAIEVIEPIDTEGRS